MVANPETVKGEAESEASVHVFCVMLILELNDRHDKKKRHNASGLGSSANVSN